MTLNTLDDRIRIPNIFDPTIMERQSEIRKIKFSKDKNKVFYSERQNKLIVTKLGMKWLRLEQATNCFLLTKVTFWVKKKETNVNQGCGYETLLQNTGEIIIALNL